MEQIKARNFVSVSVVNFEKKEHILCCKKINSFIKL